MTSYTISYTNAAVLDLVHIYDYLSAGIDRAVADRVRRRITTDIKDLRTMPERAAIYDVEPWSAAGLRKYLVAKHYQVFLLVDHEARIVTIQHIFFASADFDSALTAVLDISD